MKQFSTVALLVAVLSLSALVERGYAQGPSMVAAATGDTLVTPQTKYITSAATNNSTLVSSLPGNVYGYSLINTTATIYFLRMYNLSSAPTCSSATGFVESIPIPASTAGAGVQRPQPLGQAFTTGIGFCLTAEGTSTGNTSAATGVYIALLVKVAMP